MSAFDETFDYLALFELDPNSVAFESASDVREKINRKKKEWTGQAINPLYQQQARANLERSRQFEQLLKQPDALHAYLGFHAAAQAERREQQEAVIGELVSLACAGGRSHISDEQHAILVRACEERSIPFAVLDSVIRARNLEIRELEADSAGGKIPYRQPTIDRALMTQIAGNLKLLGKESFYELLDLPSTSSPTKLLNTARILYDRWSKALPKTSTCVAWEKSLQACLTYLKDGEAKARYDNALANRRLDEFLGRVDLVLAGGRFTKDDHVFLVTLGVREFGLTGEMVNLLVRLRAASKGLALSKPVHVSVQLAGLVRCRRCFRYTSAGATQCRHCSGSLEIRCGNPACQKPLPAEARHCEHCGLPVARGTQYRELLRLGAALIDGGDGRGAQNACRLARQILSSPAVEELAHRAGKVRLLATTIRRAAAERRWSQVERELTALLALAPHSSQPGLPNLEEVSRFLTQMRGALTQVPADASPESEAQLRLEILQKWADCEEMLPRLQQLVVQLESQCRYQTALAVAQRLAVLEPAQDVWKGTVARLQQAVDEERDEARRKDRLQDQYRQALAASRFYAAERLASEMKELGLLDESGVSRQSFREELRRTRQELELLRQEIAKGISTDDQIARYLEILERCRDCREALSALQTLRPAAPGVPENLQVVSQGTRRALSWGPPSGPAPTSYVIQRSVQRPNGRLPDVEWAELAEVHVPGFVDDTVFHAGTIVRYSVAAQRRGSLSVAGNVLQEYSVASLPGFFTPIIVWQEVVGLKLVRRTDDHVELTWHVPSAVRQVLVETWDGPRDARPAAPVLLASAAPGRLIAAAKDSDAPRSYRVACVYDGPEGDFITPGAIVTLAPGEPIASAPSSPNAPRSALPPNEPAPPAETVAPPDESAGATDFAEILTQAPVDEPPRPAADANPLKRMGLWPPVPRKG